ncbi:uncharacterized protein LOC113468701 [Diaphorina citri]|uniref:Uncharacterized protein LOC113468701 n=1 Tax=Diaphorina citri TaxID=121845 RepID=A0A3Q0IZI0_DIACI|nr:uncharacterized protein LOC113468701 [Diaphorina citri]
MAVDSAYRLCTLGPTLSCEKMGDFHRTYSKVWWPNLNLEDSLSPSSSPSSSNGSHRSQDSGFSDSSRYPSCHRCEKMGDFHRTYSKVWWPNLNLEDSLSPSSSPSSSNGSHRSQDSGFSDSSTSKQSAEHLRNFAHTPENQIHSSPEPCENIAEEVEGNEDIILPESQYSDTPIRARKPVKSNTQEKDKKAYTSVHNNSTVLDNGVTSHLLHHDVTKSRQNQSLSGKPVQTPPYSEPPKYKPTGLIESEKLNYLRKKDNRKSLGLIRNPDKKSSIENTKKNRHSMSLNLVSHQNEENVNPRLYQSYSEQQQLYQRQNPTLPQTRSNEIFRETYNFQPYRTDKNQNQNSKTSRVIEMRTPVGSNKKASTMSNQNVCTIENLPHATSSQELYAASVYSNTNVIPEVQNTQKDPASEISSDMKSVLSENRTQSTSERNSVIFQNLKPAQRQLLENLTANYFSKSNSLDKDERNTQKDPAIEISSDMKSVLSENRTQSTSERNSVILQNLKPAQRQLLENLTVLLSTLEKDRTPATVLSTLSSLTKLGLDSAHLGNLVARYPGGGMRTILSVCLDVPCLHVTICALRTITLLCSSVQCIRQLEKCNGIEILADILADESRDETVLSEAISVLAQVTAPWLDTNQSVADLHRHVDTFVAALTRLVVNDPKD